MSTITVTLPAVCTGRRHDRHVRDGDGRDGPLGAHADRELDGAPTTVADYLTSSTPFTYYVPASGTLGRLSVDIPVNVNPTDTSTEWRLQDDIVLRNTTRL